MSSLRSRSAELMLVVLLVGWQAMCADGPPSPGRVEAAPEDTTIRIQDQQKANDALLEELKKAREDLAQYEQLLKHATAGEVARRKQAREAYEMLKNTQEAKEKALRERFELEQKYMELQEKYQTALARQKDARPLTPASGQSAHVMPLQWTLRRTSKVTTVEDDDGRWEYSGGEVRVSTRPLGYYSSATRVSSANPLNAGAVRITLFLKGGDPPENLLLEGSQSLSTGNQMGSVAATSEDYAKYLGQTYRLTDGKLTIAGKRPPTERKKGEGSEHE